MAIVDPTLDRMRGLVTQWEAANDRRCVFLGCYTLMTANMLTGIDQARFRDGLWVNRLLHRFADYYFDALDRYDQQRSDTPPVWKQTHDATRNNQIMILQHLLLGINAHINYDLVFTLVDVLEPNWAQQDDLQRRERYDDHCTVNTIIGETVDAVQDQIIERHTPWLDVVDKAMGRADEWLASRLIARWRTDVWRHAVHLLDTRDLVVLERLRRKIEQTALHRGSEILDGLR